jgi:hypothetical protein
VPALEENRLALLLPAHDAKLRTIFFSRLTLPLINHAHISSLTLFFARKRRRVYQHSDLILPRTTIVVIPNLYQQLGLHTVHHSVQLRLSILLCLHRALPLSLSVLMQDLLLVLLCNASKRRLPKECDVCFEAGKEAKKPLQMSIKLGNLWLSVKVLWEAEQTQKWEYRDVDAWNPGECEQRGLRHVEITVQTRWVLDDVWEHAGHEAGKSHCNDYNDADSNPNGPKDTYPHPMKCIIELHGDKERHKKLKFDEGTLLLEVASAHVVIEFSHASMQYHDNNHELAPDRCYNRSIR